MRLVADGPLDARTIVHRLDRQRPRGQCLLADLTAAGGGYSGAALVGASPELLVARHGDRVICRPFAGSAPRLPDPDADQASGAALAASAKNRHEHQLVVDAMRAALDPLCVELQIAPQTEAEQDRRRVAPVHARSPVDCAKSPPPHWIWRWRCTRRPRSAEFPPTAAAEMITELEGDRGFYAGAVGWCDQRGDGRWVVSIRCAQLSADRRTAYAYSGGGIVAESETDDEVDETTTKFKTMLAALGVKP